MTSNKDTSHLQYPSVCYLVKQIFPQFNKTLKLPKFWWNNYKCASPSLCPCASVLCHQQGGRRQVKLKACILTSPLDTGKWTASCCRHFIWAPDTQWTEGWVHPRGSVEVVIKLTAREFTDNYTNPSSTKILTVVQQQHIRCYDNYYIKCYDQAGGIPASYLGGLKFKS
jgi:hypothetical protein